MIHHISFQSFFFLNLPRSQLKPSNEGEQPPVFVNPFLSPHLTDIAGSLHCHRKHAGHRGAIVPGGWARVPTMLIELGGVVIPCRASLGWCHHSGWTSALADRCCRADEWLSARATVLLLSVHRQGGRKRKENRGEESEELPQTYRGEELRVLKEFFLSWIMWRTNWEIRLGINTWMIAWLHLLSGSSFYKLRTRTSSTASKPWRVAGLKQHYNFL